MRYNTIDEIIAANEAAGQHWFSQDSMKMFGCVLRPEVYDGKYFITSEQDTGDAIWLFEPQALAWDGQRRWSIREALADGTVTTVSEYGQYASYGEAVQAVTDLVREQMREQA
jgi:hypothetical protein